MNELDMQKIDAALVPPCDPVADAAADTAGEIVDHLRAAGKLADRLPADWQERWSDCFADALNRAKGMLYPHYLES